jgi:hypothetical protein
MKRKAEKKKEKSKLKTLPEDIRTHITSKSVSP